MTALRNRAQMFQKEGRMANPFAEPNSCSNTMNIGIQMGRLAQTVKKISKQRVKRMVNLDY